MRQYGETKMEGTRQPKGRKPANSVISGPLPLLVTPWTEDARLDIEVLVGEAEYVMGFGVGGIIWPTAGEVLWNLSAIEYESGLRALAMAARATTVIATCPGLDSASAVERVKIVQRIVGETGASMAVLARPPNDAADQAAIAAHYEAVAKAARIPVVIQTFNDGNSPLPDVGLLARLSREHPDVYGCVKEDAPGLVANGRMAELRRNPEIRTVFSSHGAKAWMFQGTKLGTDGIITQRPHYASLLASIYRLMKKGRQSDDPEMADLFCKLLYLNNLGDTFVETDDAMRGPHLYILQKLGIFRNRLTRDGKGVLSDYTMSDPEKREIEQRMRYCGLI